MNKKNICKNQGKILFVKKSQNKNIKIKKTSIVFALFFITSILFAQTQLSNLNTTWSTVLSGEIITKPETTSYGFICITDGRTISCVSNSGKVVWEKPIYRAKNPIIKTISDDFTVVITDSNQKISLFNPSGVELWEKISPWEITDQPFEGRDGRFFLRGSENICCYGINGICKWEINTEVQSELPMQEMVDGSLIVFLKALREGKTRAIRISPFGEIIDEITFSGEVLTSATSSAGALLTFTDGNAGLFTVENNTPVNKWVLKSDSISFTKSKSNLFVANREFSECYFLFPGSGGIGACKIDSQTGEVISEFTIPGVALGDIVLSNFDENGFFISDSKTACFFNQEDDFVWSGKLPDRTKAKTKWKYAILSSNCTLVLVHENWTINSYRVSQTISKDTKTAKKPSYESFYTVDPSVYQTIYKYKFNQNLISDERLMSLRSGFYGTNEITYVSEMESAIKAYLQHLNSSNVGTRIEKNVFETNASAIEIIYFQLPYFSSTDFANYTAKLISAEKNSSLLNRLLIEIKKNGYDPDGEILKALEKLANSTSNPSPVLAENICDAVYSVCRFMGRPAFNKSGNKIITKFLSTNSKAKARETLKALSELDL